MQSKFKTPKGTELPLIDLKGKPYLQVAHRLVWFREEHPGWGIETQVVEHDTTHAVVRATIRNGDTVIANGTKSETKIGFADYLEKAETGAIGRALALCGFGTQFAPELDEGERLADAPVAPGKKAPAKKATGELQELKDLVILKLGADPTKDGDTLAKLNDRFKFGFKSATEIKPVQLRAMVAALRKLPDAPPFPDSTPKEEAELINEEKETQE